MSQQYFVKRGEQVFGPCPIDEVKLNFASGKLGSSDSSPFGLLPAAAGVQAKRMLTLAIAAGWLALFSWPAMCEPVNEIVVGGYYYVKGIFEDSKVQVLSVDRVGKRVKVYDQGSQIIDWVDAAAVITRSESVDRDIDRIQIGARILGVLWESMKPAGPEAPRSANTWSAGNPHPSIPNLIAAANKDEWVPRPGYAWAKDGSARVVWTAGLQHPSKADWVSSYEEGKWGTATQLIFKKMELEGKAADEGRKERKPDPPNVSGVLFGPGELDIYCKNTEFDTLFFFHGKVVDYNAIAHVIFDGDDHWVVVVFKDGRRLDLGVKIAWLVRPCFFFASGVNIVRTRDGETLEMRRIPLLRVDKGHAVKERYMLGVRFTEGTEMTTAGPRRVLYEVMEGAAAAEAGLKKGDAIISVDGQIVGSIDELVSLMDRKPGEAVTIEYSRKGKIDKVAITPRLGTGVVKTNN